MSNKTFSKGQQFWVDGMVAFRAEQEGLVRRTGGHCRDGGGELVEARCPVVIERGRIDRIVRA